MESLFLTVLNMSLTAGYLVLAVLVLRLIFKKAPKSLAVVMWALVGIRLLCPFTLESALSLLPSGEPIPQEILASSSPQIQTGLPAINAAINPVIGTVLEPTDAQVPLQTPARSFAQIAATVWLVGVAVMLLYAAFSYLQVRRSVREGMHLKDRLWLCDHISSPFILGIFRPRIYVPSSMAATDLEYVMAHEQAHLERKDHWWKPLGFGLLSIHWFNPLLWLGYIFLCRDIELACDEAVLRKLGTESKKPYSEALLNCSIPRRSLAACPLAFGEVGVKTRIKSVLNYKKPALWIILAAVLTCALLAMCFLTNPKTEMPLRMDLTVRSLINGHHHSDHFASRACCSEYELLGMKKRGRTTTLYLSVMYEEYSLKDGELYGENGSHTPTVITLVQKDGMYTLKEYWEPRDGSYYPKDIRKKFPIRLWDEALNIQQYAKQLQKSCDEQAQAQMKNLVNRDSQKEQNQLMELQCKFPEYFGLSTTKGLEVYVWQMGPNVYSWVLREGKNRVYTWEELWQLPTATTREMQAIVASYGLSAQEVSIHPTFMPHSSYYYNIDLVYQQKVEQLFWGSPELEESDYNAIMDAMTFDIDGDGIEEHCTLGPGPTSGVFSFALSVTEQGEPEYHSIYTGSFYQLSFEQQPDGQVWLRGENQRGIVHYFSFEVRDGSIALIGQQEDPAFLDAMKLLLQPEQNLSLAIARALQSNHRSEEPDGLVHTQSYVLLDQQWVSGTPLVGNQTPVERVTVYLLVQQMEYSMFADFPEKVRGQFLPALMTFEVDGLGNFTLTEYEDRSWVVLPRFPETAAQEAENSEKYETVLEERCYALALQQQYWQQGILSETYDVWKQRYDLAMAVRILAD